MERWMSAWNPSERLNHAGARGLPIGTPKDGGVTRSWATTMIRKGLARRIVLSGEDRLVSTQPDLFI